MTWAYYNEHDPFAAEWLRRLILFDHIAPGEVDERSITEVSPDDLRGFAQCHFFAGIGVWSHALRRAGWPDDRPVWTGSCPCQPFSAAGKQKGFDDERHLWPVWFNLIGERRPPVVLGEQVASALDWLDLVSADMEAAGYAFGASDLCAAGFGGAHIRQRLYFVGVGDALPAGRPEGWTGAGRGSLARPEPARGVADADHRGPQGRGRVPERADERAPGPGSVAGGLADARCPMLQSRFGLGDDASAAGQAKREAQQLEWCRAGDRDGRAHGNAHAPLLGRNAVDWLYCRDGKWRPVEPGTFPLADAAPARVGRLRAYGNALDAETATQFVGAVRDVICA